MNKRQARPSSGILEREKAGTTTTHNYTVNEFNGQLSIARILGHGQDAAITRRDLERLTGLDGRTVRIIIERERRRGTPILSDCQHGYYLPGNEVEKMQFVKSMRRRAHEIIKTANAVEGGVTRWPLGE